MSQGVIETQDSTFETDVLKSDFAFVDFWAEWCGPCKAIAPVFETLSGLFEQVKFVKLNVDHSPSIASKYGIRSIPTLILFKGGSEVDRWTRLATQDELSAFLEKHLS